MLVGKVEQYMTKKGGNMIGDEHMKSMSTCERHNTTQVKADV